MQIEQQQSVLNYERYAKELLAEDPSDYIAISHINQIKLQTSQSIHITQLPLNLRKHRKNIIHDINLLNTAHKNSRKRSLHQKVIQQQPCLIKSAKLLLETIIPTPREQIQELKAAYSSVRAGNDDYLKHNMNTIKQKIKNKLLRQRVDFATSISCQASMKRETIRQASTFKQESTKRQRIDRYNHEFQEYLIRKKMNRKSNTEPSQPREQEMFFNQDLLRLEVGFSPKQEKREGLLINGKQRKQYIHKQNNTDQARMIIVSRLNPVQNTLIKFKNIFIENARKTSSQHESAQLMLRRYVNRHFGKSNHSQSPKEYLFNLSAEKKTDLSNIKISSPLTPATPIKAPINYSLFKRQIQQVRKESMGLPQLLQAQEQGDQLKMKDRHSKKKYVIYSKKNLQSNLAQVIKNQTLNQPIF